MPANSSSPLEASVLVLNKLFMAIHIISVRRAFTLLCKDVAEVVSLEDGQFATYNFATWREVSEYRARYFRQEDDDWVRTVNSEIQVPRVIRLLGYEKLPKQTVKFNRRNIFARDNNQCQYCGRKFPTAELSLDHVTPRSQGGSNTWENIVCACVSCNVRKGGRTPKQAHLSLQATRHNEQLDDFIANSRGPLVVETGHQPAHFLGDLVAHGGPLGIGQLTHVVHGIHQALAGVDDLRGEAAHVKGDLTRAQ